MTTKIKKMPLKISVVLAAFLFACGNGNQPPFLKIIQAEHTTSETTLETIRKRMVATETNAEENNDKTAETMPESEENVKQFVQNWLWYAYLKENLRPLLNGNPWAELERYVNDNNRFRKIAEEAGIKEYWRISCAILIDKNGSIDVPVKIPPAFENHPERSIVGSLGRGGQTTGIAFLNKNGNVIESTPPSYQLLADEMLRLVNSTQGKWTPGTHDGEPMKVMIAIMFSSDELL